MTSTNLNKARNLTEPERGKVLQRDYCVKEFWENNNEVLIEAWKEWEQEDSHELNIQVKELVDEKLRSCIEEAWKNPERENLVRDFLLEVSPGVFQFQFFNPKKLVELRKYLDKVDKSQIPLRAPYGIVLNRKGAMLDQRSEGHLAAPSFQSLYQEVLDKYMRPIARLLYPETTGYDTQTFGFSIQYRPESDTSIRMHTDASSVTLNINLNLREERYTGSEVDFHDPIKGRINRVRFEPGTAIIHRGNVPHAAQPITSGERTNLVLWLYGDQMQIPRYIDKSINFSPKERWTLPKNIKDSYAPF